MKCFDALSSCQFFFHHHSCVWLQLSFLFPEGLSLLCHATRFSTVCVVDNSNVDMGTWLGNAPTSGYRKKKFWSFLVKVKFSVCVWGVGAWKLPGWLASKWCSSVYWLLLLARIWFFFNVCILYLYWMQDILLWKSPMQTEPTINRFQ